MSHIMNTEREELYKFAGQILLSRQPLKILDVACGNGEGMNVLSQLMIQTKIIGIDLSPELIKHANENFSNTFLSFSVANALNLPFPDKSFDGLVCSHAIEHFNEIDQNKLLKELNRVLKNNGILVIATPDRDVWDIQGIAGLQEDHIRELTQAEFWSILENFNFKIEGIYGQCILKENKSFLVRKIFNFLKKIDVLRLRKKMFRNYIKTIDQKTQPVTLDFRVKKLEPQEKASITILVCRKKS